MVAAGILIVAIVALCANALSGAGGFGSVERVHSAAGPALPETATVDGVISRIKLSPSGRRVHGFYLDNGTEVNLPPHAHEACVGEVGQRVEVTGHIHTNLVGESLVNAASITNDDTGTTLDIENVVPHAKGTHAKGKA